MALNRKYAGLPDLDSAPDVYETPETLDDASTAVASTFPGTSDYESVDDNDEIPSISRSRLNVHEARSRFGPSRLDARNADFSDRINAKRQAYRASNARYRRNGGGGGGDLSGRHTSGDDSEDDEEEEESLEDKIARLKREVAEIKQELADKEDADEDDEEQEEEFDTISEMLAALPRPGRPRRAVVAKPSNDKQSSTRHTAGFSDASATADQQYVLAKTADFDTRLVSLEKTLGISSTTNIFSESSTIPRPVVPTLEELQRQIATLSEASPSSLDTVGRRVRALTQEAEQLEKARRQAKAAKEALASTTAAARPGRQPATTTEEPDDADQTAKINALYGTLPTLESLTPLLPQVLERLRSLRDLHNNAALASETLDRVEEQQAKQAEDMAMWRDALEKIEGNMERDGVTVEENLATMEGWVRDLEAKLTRL